MWIKEVIALLLAVVLATCAPQGRIVNGTSTNITSYPFMASLRSYYGHHYCGCTIIASRWILTAAHCVDDTDANSISVQYGVSEITESGPTVAKVKRIIKHKDYFPQGYYPNDIALLELSEELIFNYKTLAPVNLPKQNYEVPQVPKGAQGVLIGWGSNVTGGQVQTTLHEAELKIYSDKECISRHNGNTWTDLICGGVDEGGKGQCDGDGGDPLLQRVPGGGLIQLGVASWSIKPCAIYPFPGVFTKVSHYINWIHETIEKYSKE